MRWVPTGTKTRSFIASGNGGQMIVVLPARNIKAVQTVDSSQTKDPIPWGPFFTFFNKVVKHLAPR